MNVYLTIYSSVDQRKHQSSAPLAFGRGIPQWPVYFLHKGPVTRKMFPFHDDILNRSSAGRVLTCHFRADLSNPPVSPFGYTKCVPSVILTQWVGSAADTQTGTYLNIHPHGQLKIWGRPKIYSLQCLIYQLPKDNVLHSAEIRYESLNRLLLCNTCLLVKQWQQENMQPEMRTFLPEAGISGRDK